MFSKWFGSGWKVKLGSVIAALPAVINVIGSALNGHPAISEHDAMLIGAALGMLGIGHKIEKAGAK